MLKNVYYSFTYDSDYTIIFFKITYPTSAWEEFPRWEEKRYRFGMMYKEEIGVQSLTRWTGDEPFVRGEIHLQFRFLINYIGGAKIQFLY
jgi:hypothetical protein